MRRSRTIASAVLALLLALGGACADDGGDGSAQATPAPETERPSARRSDDPPTALRDTLEELREAQAAERHPSDGGGRAWLELPEGDDGSVQAGSSGRWTIVYEAGPLGVEVGGNVQLLAPPFWEWSPAQHELPEMPGYTTVESLADGVDVEVAAYSWLQATIRGRKLEEGERLRFVYGAGEALARADVYAERDSRFWIAVDGDGDGVRGVVGDSPGITVHAGPPARLALTLPSVTRPDEAPLLRVAVLDAAGSVCRSFAGELTLATSSEGWTLPETVVLSEDDEGARAISLPAPAPGVHRVQARLAAVPRAVEGESNPLLVSSDAPRIRWGDLHGHSNLSDGTGTPEDFYRYARDVAALDVAVLTDHDHWGVQFLDESPDLWKSIQETTHSFHDPGTFVTFVGYEWTNWVHGHRHVLYAGEEGPVLSSIDPQYETPAQLWEGLAERELDALTFAHHSAGGPVATDWRYPPDPRFEPVTEIVSVHGSSEASDSPIGIYRPLAGNYVRDVLNLGYRFGFIGSGDSHDGHPGHAHLGMRSGGLAAILTDDLTRDGVFAAMHARRVYASNGPRIVLQCGLDGHGMGSAMPAAAPDSRSMLFIRAIACAPLERVDIVRNGQVEVSIEVDGGLEETLAFELDALDAGDYLYVRVVQEDEGAAWSSPFYID